MQHRRLSDSIAAVVGAFLFFTGCDHAAKPRPQSPSVQSENQKRPDTEVQQPVVKRPPPSNAFVGSAACSECHATIAQQYAGHPMGRSMIAAGQKSELEDYTVATSFDLPRTPRTKLTTSYKVDKSDNKVLHHEIVKSEDGEVLYDLSVPIHYGIGSGKRGRSYFTNRDGIFLMSPVTWYSGTQQWDLSPGYIKNNLHFGRRVPGDCIACHAGHVALDKTRTDAFAKQPFLEECISCERCHGPAEQHVKFHQADNTSTSTDLIVNPGKLPSVERDHVCFQCHLAGASRVTRYGLGSFDFRPGDRITDIWTVFLKEVSDKDDQANAVSQVEQMLISKCYKNSEGKLGCVTCHDPHQTPTEGQREQFYRDKCISCHSAEQTVCSLAESDRLTQSPGDSCISCHMPRIEANDVPHTSQTNHRVPKKTGTETPPSDSPGKKSGIFDEDSQSVPKPELDRARGIYLVTSAERSGKKALVAEAIPMLQTWVNAAPDDIDAGLHLGIAYWLLGDVRSASKIWIQTLELAPAHEEALYRMMVLCHETGQGKTGIEYGRRLVQVNSWEAEYWGRLAHMLGQQGQHAEAATFAERALVINPMELRLHLWLAEVYVVLGNHERSEYHQQQFTLKSQ